MHGVGVALKWRGVVEWRGVALRSLARTDAGTPWARPVGLNLWEFLVEALNLLLHVGVSFWLNPPRRSSNGILELSGAFF